jgi:hypothetical protein
MNYIRPEADIAVGDEGAERAAESDVAAFHLIDASGTYKWKHLPFHSLREELRLDVDGLYPQMTASGTIRHAIGSELHWIASLVAAGGNRWNGGIWYKDGAGALLPHTNVDVTVHRTPFGIGQTATVTFSGGALAPRTRTYFYSSRYFHPVEFEFDTVQGTTAVTEIDTAAHPNRPVTLPAETLSIGKVFRRAGFNVNGTGNNNVIPLAAAGADALWSDMEMHDAMQIYWSRFANKAQWSMWVLFAALHESGTGLGGIMFDDIGPNHRQGTALFNDSFIKDPPAGDPAPAAWAARSKFWTACHEMGHAFNLAHSWQKSLGTLWIPLADEPDALSFMNYYFFYPGGEPAFFADFHFRFSDQELVFMRHAPARFVQMGNADWFDHHGFEQAVVLPHSALRLELRANRAKPVFEFLEPPVLELKLTNVSDQPVLVDEGLLDASDEMTVVIKKQGKAARRWVPFARYCSKSRQRVLEPGASMYQSLFAAAGRNGWDLAEPGMYEVQAALRVRDEDVVSNRLHLRIATPRSFEEESLAQGFFSDDVGRILAFDGSQHLQAGNDALREVVERLPDRRVAWHAQVALANPLSRNYKLLALGEGQARMMSAAEADGRFKVVAAKVDAARKTFGAALLKNPEQAAESLGHVDYKYYVDRYAEWLAAHDDAPAAADCQERLYKTLAARKVSEPVLQEVARRRDSYRSDRGAAKKKKS